MPDSPEIIVAQTTFPSREVALSISRELVEAHLVACAQLHDSVQSIYLWQGALEHEHEVTATYKLSKQQLKSLITKLNDLHPYETPQLTWHTTSASPQYSKWVEQSQS